MQPRGRNPMNDMMMLRDDVVKETDYLASRMRKPPAWPRPPEDLEPYRLPLPGDRVSLRAMRRRPELSGAVAHVVSGADADGFVTVRVGGESSGSLKQVHLERLRPLDPPSDRKQAVVSSAASTSEASRRSRPGSAVRPSSAVRSSRPSSAKEANGDARLSPDEIQQQLIRQKLGPYQAAAAYAASAAKSAVRSRSEPGPAPVSFLTSPHRRMEDAWQHLPAGSEEERQALYEELQGWYFCPPSAPFQARARPPMLLLEEAAATVKAKNGSIGRSPLWRAE
ncbi:unnamed protein product [Durusdinium trenchii]|uniref:Uncharacterized protein n=1 Tax=Durusdinium trenchii TaxID=1381693 RepID=A0ABP0K970_9DINO